MKKNASKNKEKETFTKEAKGCSKKRKDITYPLNGKSLPKDLHVSENMPNISSSSNPYLPPYQNHVITIEGIKSANEHAGHFFSGQDINCGLTVIEGTLDGMSPSYPVYHPIHPEYVGVCGATYSKSVLASFSTANLMNQTLQTVNLLAKNLAPWASYFPSEGYTNSQNVIGRMINEAGLAVSKLGSYSGLHDSFTGQFSELTKFQDKFNALASGLINDHLTVHNAVMKPTGLTAFSADLAGTINQFMSHGTPLSVLSGLSFTGKGEILQSSFKDWEKLSTLPIGINDSYSPSSYDPLKYTSEMLTNGAINGYLGNLSYGLTENHFSMINTVGNVYKKVNDVSASYASINTHLYNNLRWLPQEHGGVWEAEYPISKKSEDKQIEQLKADVVNLKEEVKRLRLLIKKRDEGYAYLIESKLEIVEERLQLALVASENKNLPTLLEHNTEDLIDKYGVMNMLKISESTYHRNKHIWPTYQIGSKKLYKASEIKAHIKQFLK